MPKSDDKIGLRIPSDLKDFIERRARESGVSASEVVRSAVEDTMQRTREQEDVEAAQRLSDEQLLFAMKMGVRPSRYLKAWQQIQQERERGSRKLKAKLADWPGHWQNGEEGDAK